MEGYTKLFSGIVMSTVWTYDSDTKVIWVTMLALADERGHVVGTVPGLAKVAGVSIEATRRALETFMAPDPDSGSKEFGGRRIEPIDRGWFLINHGKYRALRAKDEKLEADRARIAEKRAAARPSETPTISAVSQVSHFVAEVAQAEAEAKAGSLSGDLDLSSASSEQSESDAGARDPSGTGHVVRRKPFDGPSLVNLFGRLRTEAIGGIGFNGVGPVDPAKAANRAAIVNDMAGGIQSVEPSMRAFWADVKSGEAREAAKIARDGSFAFGCWFVGFHADHEERLGKAPAVAGARGAAGASGSNPMQTAGAAWLAKEAKGKS